MPRRRDRNSREQLVAKWEAARQAIQVEFLRLLTEADFDFQPGSKEPRGIQARVVENVNKMRYGDETLSTNHRIVSRWVKRLRDNKWKMVPVKQDYSKSSQSSRKFFLPEQMRIRQMIKQNKMKATQVTVVWSDKENDFIPVSPSTARKYLKRRYSEEEPSMLAARPKAMKVGGNTPHHDRCRLHESLFLKMKGLDYIKRSFHADESKIKFKERPNKQIDIEWVYRGEAGEANWFEDQRHPGQINLFLMISRNGVELYEIFHKNMNMEMYKTKILPKIGAVLERNPNFSYYLHDNFMRGSQPTEELNHYVGEGKWTQYMGRPCTKPHETWLTPVTKRPVRVAADVCECTFPNGPIHAAYHPKFNLTEEAFDKIKRLMLKNKRADAIAGRNWPLRGSGKKKWWTTELHKAIKQFNDDKAWFQRTFDRFMNRCNAFIASEGKRVKTSKW